MNTMKMKDGTNLYVKEGIALNPKARVIITHGFAEHLDRYEHFANFLVNNGFYVLRYDLRAHGRSGQRTADIKSFSDFSNDLREIVQYVKNLEPKIPVFTFGHSMGGLITSIYGVENPNEVTGQIFSGAALERLPVADQHNEKLMGLAKSIIGGVKISTPLGDKLCGDDDVYKEYIKDTMIFKKASIRFMYEFIYKGYKLTENMLKDYNYPVLILHGSEDKIVPKSISESFYSKISSKDKQIKIYQGLYHEILNEKNKSEIEQDIAEWILKRI